MNEKDIDIIENYLAGILSEEDQKQVETRLLTDQEFAQRVEIFKSLPHVISEESHNFRNELEGLYHEYHQQKNVSSTISRRTFLIAASVALLVSVIGILIWLLPNSFSTQEIYASNFTMPADNITVRNEQEISPALQSAMKAYNQQDYTTAITLFESILESDGTNAPVQFYNGVSYLNLGENEQAIQNLQKVSQTKDPAYATSAQWYLGLTYLKQDNLGQAREIFSSLKDSGSSYASKAETILQQLEDQ